MFCRYCGKKLKEGEICDCQKDRKVSIRTPQDVGGQSQQNMGGQPNYRGEAVPPRPPVSPRQPQYSPDYRPDFRDGAVKEKKRKWNIFLTLSIIFMVLAVLGFVALRVLFADKTGTGELQELLIYAVPAALGIFACLMALISFKDRHLWKKSLIAFLVGAVIAVGFCAALVIFPGGKSTEVREEESEADSEDEEDSEKTDFREAEATESGGEETEGDTGEEKGGGLAQLKADYKSGKLDYVGIKQALAKTDADNLQGEDVDLFLELQENAELDLERTIEQNVQAEAYEKAYTLLAAILKELPEDKAALELQEAYAADCLLYLQEQSKALAQEGKEEQAEDLLNKAKEYYPDESKIEDLLENLADAKGDSKALNGDYIIADSASRYLTDADVKDLSLKEINYAKNEIYARHGRKFDSKELQNYFDSKSWYKGTVSPSKFDISVFNKYEKKNAEFLSAKEFEIDSKGYQLDQ